MHIDTAPRLVTPPLLLRLVSVAASSIGFYLPLSVVPLLAGPAAGLATVSLLAATVLVELVTPQLVARAGYRWALAAGLVLLGLPTVALSFDASPAAIVAVSVLRGAGFAVCTVAGGALTATLIPAGRRGEGLALVGLTTGVTSLLALPAGVWAATRWGYTPVFAATAVCTLLALLTIPGLPRRTAAAAEGNRGVLAGLRIPALTRPAAIFAASTTAIGVLVTYLPLAAADLPAWVAPAALLAQPAAATAARWFAGRHGDRHGPSRLLTPGLLLAALGTAGLAGGPVPMVAGALLLGAGFGVLQNATLTLMYNRVPAGGESTVSAIWNSAYDLGMAAGALVAGLIVASAGYPATFLLTAAAMLPALALIRRDRRPEHMTPQ
ncbi:MFS transporter [Dactylosporangium sp. AC04546]|uniref:MFS transporter n=1 Tax=Dactylosporangium sp. AC04546 TaxID=2862460 RepID=UPI001EE025A8|nr:MFS transporter [Dactylosporangium sp. AC04546]WVK81200.1 MFS transporter [Dactylosporangium sp. AC04546]